MRISRQSWIYVAGAVVLIGAGLFWAATKNKYVFRFSQSDIENVLAQRTPLTKTYLAVFEVTLERPRVALEEDSERIGAGVDVLLNIRLGDNQVPLRGMVDMSGAVEYRADEAAFFLADPEIEALNIDGVPARYSNRSHQVIKKAIEAFYDERPLYSLEGEQASKTAARMVLRDVIVENGMLVVTLGLGES